METCGSGAVLPLGMRCAACTRAWGYPGCAARCAHGGGTGGWGRTGWGHCVHRPLGDKAEGLPTQEGGLRNLGGGGEVESNRGMAAPGRYPERLQGRAVCIRSKRRVCPKPYWIAWAPSRGRRSHWTWASLCPRPSMRICRRASIGPSKGRKLGVCW